jgi:hypothetical protein
MHMEEEDNDTVAPLCTCGQSSHNNNFDDTSNSKASSKGGGSPSKKTPAWLESSFVHLMAPRRPRQESSKYSQQQQHQQQHAHHCQPHHGYLEQHQHLLQLLDAVSSSSSSSSSEEVSLCMDCVDRVAAALETDTQRMYGEINAYHEAVAESKQKQRTINETISKKALEDTERTYMDEIEMIRQEVQAREEELGHLYSLYKEQTEITQQSEVFEEQILQEQNALELQSLAFDDSLQLLSKSLGQIQHEVDRLSMVKLPQTLFDLQVDERGLRYPLINQLRLAYRPKGDVPVSEIQVAWSQATQLLLTLGTLLRYPSSDWKIVPLADCSKLIFRKEIFNLKPGDCRGLMAWNALLDQVIKHAMSMSQQPCQPGSNKDPTPPFPSSPSSIGNTELAHLDQLDHVGWSQVIHRMASNLLWLSECASELVAFQVSTVAHSLT